MDINNATDPVPKLILVNCIYQDPRNVLTAMIPLNRLEGELL
jgi:hypothetical protein